MTEPLSAWDVSKLFKNVFAGKKGKVVLEKIKTFCLGDVQHNMADTKSTNQTFYNLGAYAVYRYIQHQIDLDLGETVADCVTEPKPKQGE